MRPAINGVDIIRKGIDFFVVRVVVLDRYFDRERIRNTFKIQRLLVQHSLVFVQMFYEFGNPTLVIELVRTLRLRSLVLNRYSNAFIKECLFAQSLRQFIKAEFADFKYVGVWFEGNLRPAPAGLSGLF